MAARDDTNLEEALEILSRRVEENNREVEESLETIYGDLEDHEEQIIEMAHFTRDNRELIGENYENINELWFEIDEIHDKIDDIDGGTTNYNVDFTGLENTIKYIGGGIKNLFVSGRDRAEESGISRRQFLAGAAGLAAVDYINIVPGDKSAGDGALRGGDCGWDIDGFGLYGDQERCAPEGNGDGNGTPEYDVAAGEVYTWDEFNQCLSEDQTSRIEEGLGDPESFEYEAQIDGDSYDINIIEDDEVVAYLDNEGLECEVGR